MNQWGKHAGRGWLSAVAITSYLLASAMPASAFSHNPPDVERGQAIYAAKCAACHGKNLEGQPNWQSANADGTYPAPPHDESGHTWHHGDAMLRDYIRRGGQAVLDDMGVAFTSRMPGFAGDISDTDIEAVLDFIKSTWPGPVQAAQKNRTRTEDDIR